MSEIVLRVAGLTKRFGQITAVDSVDLTVHAGEIFGFLGPNGAGKTTTIAMALGLLHPTAGRVDVLGQQVTPDHSRVLRGVGSLVGIPGLVPSFSGRRNLRLLARLHRGVDDKRVDALLEYVGLADAADRKYKGYSLGMRQRLGLAAALLHRPALLILDEPTNGLDPAGMREMRGLLRGLAADGTTVFLSSHQLHEVEQVCDRVAVLNRGRVVAEGPVRELLQGSRVVRARVPSTGAAVAALEGLPGMTCVEANGHSIVVHGAASEAVIVRLVERGVVPSEVTMGESDLESVFLSLTKEAA